jgi:PAS domain S-box-containing protein
MSGNCMSDIFDKHPKDRRWPLVMPFVAVLAVFLIEVETPGIRVAPSLLTIALAVFALFLSPRAVFCWAVVLFIPFVLTLALVPNNGVRESVNFVALRSAAYLSVAWVAVGLSRYRQESDSKLEGLLALFDSLKTPIVLSDIDGNINFANRSCCELLGRSREEIQHTSFFSVFIQPDQRGQSIERYLKFFDNSSGGSSSMKLSVQNWTGELHRSAKCFTMQWDKQKLLVTQIS